MAGIGNGTGKEVFLETQRARERDDRVCPRCVVKRHQSHSSIASAPFSFSYFLGVGYRLAGEWPL